MIDLPKLGVYVIRAPRADNFAQQLVEHWLNAQEDSPFKSCLWFTGSPQEQVREMLEPHLLRGGKTIKGLDVVSLRALRAKNQAKESIRQLCRSLDTLCVLKPSLVILEHAELWFNNNEEPLEKRNPMAQMRLIHRWSLYAQVSVVIAVQDDLPQWSVFADGLADVTDQGQFDFRPWWPSQWGLQTNLWTEPAKMTKLERHHVLDSQIFPELKQLAQACYTLRFGHASRHGIHVQAHGELTAQEASVLLRLGADSVALEKENLSTWLGLPKNKLELLPANMQATCKQDPNFARDLHEVFMPGLLTVLSSPTFAVHGLMMLELAQRWGVHCTLTRLSLLPHMTAQTALRLANWSCATGLFTASREALYLLKLWTTPPNETDYRAWLQSCFKENLNVLFGGDIQFQGHVKQAELLADLNEELEPLQVGDLIGPDLNEAAKLAEMWKSTPDLANRERPWTQRIVRLLQGTNP